MNTNEEHTIKIPDTLPLSNDDRAKWLEQVCEAVAIRVKSKYEAGQLEHKNDLGKVPLYDLLNEMENEAIDQFIYVREMKRRYFKGDV